MIQILVRPANADRYPIIRLRVYTKMCTVMNMKRRELVQKLAKLGWHPVRQGKHEIFGHATKAYTIPVPRHTEIDEHTARGILRDAER